MTTKSSTAEKRAALTVSMLSAFMSTFMGSSINIALPQIGGEFKMDAVLLSWVATSYILASAVFMIPAGRAGDITGRKKIFLSGVTVFTLASFFTIFAPSKGWLIAARVTQGIGAPMIFASSNAILVSVFPKKERGKALGIAVAAVYAGLTTGPLIGGVLTTQFGWRAIFWATIPAGVIIILTALWKLKGEWAEAKGEKFDFAGAFVFGAGLVGLIYGLSELPSLKGGVTAGAGVIALMIFTAIEKKAGYPLIDLDLFKKNKAFAFSSLAAFIHYSSTFGIVFLMSLYLQYIKALTPQEAGLVIMAQPAMMALLSPLAGRVSDKVEPGIVASAGMSVTAAGLFMLVNVGENTSVVFIAAVLLGIGVGYAFFSSPNTNAIMSSVDKKHLGIASGITGAMRMTGQMTGIAVCMVLFSLIIGKVEVTPEHHDGFLKAVKTAFTIFGFLCVTGIFASLARGKVRGR